MKTVHEWVTAHPRCLDKPWLIIGKGPSFSDVTKADLSNFFTVGINHVVRENLDPKLDFLHVFDLDVIDQIGKDCVSQFQYLVMPEYPNISHKLPLVKGTFFKPSLKPLADYVSNYPLLALLSAEGRLLTYRRSTDTSDKNQQAVDVGSFSGATAVNLAVSLGVKDIYLAGIDGGTSYASTFEDLQKQNLLVSGQESFDQQLLEIARARTSHAIEVAPLNPERRPVIYVGSEKEQRLAFDVLRYTLNKYSSFSPVVHDLGEAIDTQFPEFRDITKRLQTGTPFSLQRFAIPELNHRRGMAIYLDSDMQVFADIRGLWETTVPRAGFAAALTQDSWNRNPQLSVLLIDCEKTAWDIREIVSNLHDEQLTYSELFAGALASDDDFRLLPPEWNSLEHWNARTRLYHYTDMRDQPWLSINNRNAFLWCSELLAAIAEGAITRDQVADHVQRGWVRPSLLWQLDNNVADPVLMPSAATSADRSFLPPFKYGQQAAIKRWTALGNPAPSRAQWAIRKLIAQARYSIEVSGLGEGAKKLRRAKDKIKRALSTGIGFR